jgi:hypothetical protein
MADNLTNPTPQFSTAEYAREPGANVCKSCNQTLGGTYYRVNGALTCANCAQQLKNQLPKDSHAAFVRALLFGVGGAALGLIIYAVFGILTGLMLGYISLAVGYIVGKAITTGSRGFGGRRYQIAAVLLTYMAVSMAAVPIGISQILKHQKQLQRTQVQSSTSPVTPPAPSPSGGTSVDSPQSPAPITRSPDPTIQKRPPTSFIKVLGMLTLAGLTSPFLELSDPSHGIISLIILFVGLRIAWKLTEGKQVDILGPFAESVPPAPLG